MIGIIAASMFLLALFFDIFQKNSSARLIENFDKNFTQEQLGRGLPMRLKIPKINVDSDVESVGLAPDSSIGVPRERENVAWFNTGSRPGDNGSAIIVGHYGINNKKTSAFDNLHRLRKGDKLYVEDDKGVVTTFVVRENRRYDPDADSSSVFGPNDGKSHLNLVTCEGTWDEENQQYTKRLVVFTDKE